MTQTFDIKLDMAKHIKHLDWIAKTQIPFAVARALTITAKDAKEAIGKEMTGAMTLRSNYVKAGLHVTAARKKDGLNRMTSVVGHKDWYMAQQMGKRTVERKSRNSKYQFIPRGVRRTKTGKISKNNRPSNIFKRKSVFFHETGNGRGYIFERRGGRSKLLYSAIPKQTIKPKMDFEKEAQQTAGKRLNINFIHSMRIARRSAR